MRLSIDGPVRGSANIAKWAVFCALLSILAIVVGWDGYSASDDASYYEAALHWLHNPPYAGEDHWGTRFPLILTLAAAMKLLGAGSAALTSTALLWYLLFLVSIWVMAARIGGTRCAWIATLLAGTMPVVVANATTASCDLTEAAFLVLGVTLIGNNVGNATATRHAVGAGLAFGGAILCRETTSLALLGFIPLFLLGRPLSRQNLIIMGMACAALLAAEALFQYIMTGNPLNRWTLAFHHDSHIDRAANLEGNFLVNPVLDPVLVLLVNDDFALLFWLAIASVTVRFHRSLDSESRGRTAILAILAASTFLCVSALYDKLVLNPRYFMLPAIAALIAVSVWTDRMRPPQRGAILAVAIAANLLMLSVGNAHPRWGAEALVIAAQQHSADVIVSDAETVHRASLPMEWNDIRHVMAGKPTAGTFSFTTDQHVPAGYVVVERYPSPPTTLGAVLTMLHMDGLVPSAIRRRLLLPNPTMVLSRAAAG